MEIGRGEIKYIGITKSSLDLRLYNHLWRAKAVLTRRYKDTYLYRWIRSVEYKVSISVIETVSTLEQACEYEINLIRTYPDLVNTTPGGEGVKGAFGATNHRATKIIQYSIYGDFINIFDCIVDAERATGVKAALISGNIRADRIKSAGGYIWKLFEENYPSSISPYDNTKRQEVINNNIRLKGKAVLQCDIEGKVIKEYPTKRQACREFGFTRMTLKYALKEEKLVKGYIWKYKL